MKQLLAGDKEGETFKDSNINHYSDMASELLKEPTGGEEDSQARTNWGLQNSH